MNLTQTTQRAYASVLQKTTENTLNIQPELKSKDLKYFNTSEMTILCDDVVFLGYLHKCSINAKAASVNEAAGKKVKFCINFSAAASQMEY